MYCCEFGVPHTEVTFSDPNQWEQIGRELGRSTKLRELRLVEPVDVDTLPLPTESMQSLEALYEGLKHNTSVQDLGLIFTGRGDFSVIDDLEHFMRNKRINRLEIISHIPLLSDRGRAIELAVRNSSLLVTLDMYDCKFQDNGVLEQILLSCSRIRSLSLLCDEMFICDAVAEFLQKPTTELQNLKVRELVQGGLGIIAESLANNTCLKKLIARGSVNTEDTGHFARILCDQTSLDRVKTSNHTLVVISRNLDCSQCIRDCLELNRNDDKQQVVRQKIAKYYFAGGFDVSPFASVPISIIPNVMEMIGGDDRDTKQSLQCNAIFRMLKAIPDLSNTSNREAEELEDAGEN